MSYAQSSYTPGQCTWYVAGSNSWIPPGLGNAAQWLMNAPAKGLRVGKTPQVGAVAVLEPGTPGLNVSVDGHVMDVVGVSGDTVTVRDMNWNYKPFQTTTHSLAASSISGYIYPPGGTIPAPGTAASLMGSTTPAPGIPLPFPGGLLNPLNGPFAIVNAGIGVATGGKAGASISNPLDPSTYLAPLFGGVISFLTTGGEVLIGVVAVFVGMFILVKHSDSGKSVINVASQTAKTGAKLAAL